LPDRTLFVSRWRRLCVGLFVLAAAVVPAACNANPPDRRAQVDALTQQIRGMPGVVRVTSATADRAAAARVYFELDVDVADNITADQLAAITSRYLDHLHSVDYRGYQTEFDARNGWNVFVIDNNDRAITNGDQIVTQARDWLAVRAKFPGSTVRLHATVSHGTDPRFNRDGGHPSGGSIELPDPADYTAVAATLTTLAARFPELGSGNWAVSAGKAHPADIKTAVRFPTPGELDVWNRLNADQSIPHLDALTINGPTTGPVWVSEQTVAADRGTAVRLARQHLPIVATLHPPVLYTASDEIQGHINYYGKATAPVAVTIGGCTVRTYLPGPPERALINTYEKCKE
jgi:hypothetical protein